MVICPNCGKSHYIEHYSTTTAVYYPPVYKDGVNINPDGNVTTTYCTCCNCHHNFHISREDETKEITDDGPSPEVPVIGTPITIPNEPDIIDKDSFLAPSSIFNNSVTLATSEEFKDLKLEMEKMNEYMLGIATDLRLIYSVLSKKT